MLIEQLHDLPLDAIKLRVAGTWNYMALVILLTLSKRKVLAETVSDSRGVFEQVP